MTDSDTLIRVREILESDPLWCAYAIADTCPPYQAAARWIFEADSVILRYGGLEPPILFAHGDPARVQRLFAEVSPGIYQYSLMAAHFDRLKTRLKPQSRQRMWRMVLDTETFPGSDPVEAVVPLTPGHAVQVAELFDRHPDKPDAYDESQLSYGVNYGYLDDRKLRCIAGTHVLCLEEGVAAIGNVFTHPAYRNRGMARMTLAALIQALLSRGLRTIVLNVGMHNEPALRCYEHLGFMPHCGYYEGIVEVIPNPI